MTHRKPAQYDWTKALFNDRRLSKHFTSPRRSRIKTVTLHHMTIVAPGDGSSSTVALEGCYRTWQTRQASANYGVSGNQVWQYVSDNDAAWANASSSNHETLSIEHANSTAGPGWKVSDKTMETGARLVATLHRLYGLGRPTRKTVRMHRDYFATACPGPYMVDRLGDYIARAARFYDEAATPTPTPPKPTPPKPKPEPVGKSWFGKVISKNIGWMNDTGKAKAKSAKYRQSVVDDLVELKPFAIAVQELLGIYRDDMDKRFAKAGYERSSGSDGRYVYYRKGTKVITAGVWDLRPRYKNDDRQAAYVLLDAPHGAVLVVSGHLDHSDASGETQVRQSEDVVTKGEALLRARKLPIHRAVYCLDTNSRSRVRENMIALSYYDTVRDEHRSERIDNASSYTFQGWDGKTRQNLDGIWLHTDRPCIWSGVRRRNDHLSDHRAVVAEPGLITAK